MPKVKLWLVRGLVGFVFFFNVQCAVVFILSPQSYVAGFELSGPTGEAMVRGMGILFLMWNVPYAVALWHPLRRRTSLVEAAVMQAVGVVGETCLLAAFPAGHPVFQQTGLRFILFDGTGLVLLLIAVFITRRANTRRVQPEMRT